jgi:hypothetical protein
VRAPRTSNNRVLTHKAPKEDGMFGTLTAVLPSKFESGILQLDHRNKMMNVDLSLQSGLQRATRSEDKIVYECQTKSGCKGRNGKVHTSAYQANTLVSNYLHLLPLSVV